MKITDTNVAVNTINISGKLPECVMDMPAPISVARVAFLVSKGLDNDIAELDLEMIKMKLSEPKEGIGWGKDQCEDAEIEYKRYLMLCRKFPAPHYAIVPNKIMDTMWHYHILDTRAYCRDSDMLFGGYFHHFPYFGLRGDEDAKHLKASFEKTKWLYEQTFGEPLVITPAKTDAQDQGSVVIADQNAAVNTLILMVMMFLLTFPVSVSDR